jgi:pyruvate/2-oxoglutarate dehydrogenase complex dihydrolipoamide acyltransferase (E2) component
MATVIEVRVPDIGDFKGVDVIEVMVSPGDTLAVEQPMIILESDKASMEVPAPEAGVVKEVKIKVGDKISRGDLILLLETEAMTGAPILPHGNYRYILDRGPVNAAATGTGISISGNSLLALRHEEFKDPAVLREAKRLTRAALGVHLQGRPLKTRELLAATYRRHPLV